VLEPRLPPSAKDNEVSLDLSSVVRNGSGNRPLAHNVLRRRGQAGSPNELAERLDRRGGNVAGLDWRYRGERGNGQRHHLEPHVQDVELGLIPTGRRIGMVQRSTGELGEIDGTEDPPARARARTWLHAEWRVG
jgi:hypothetical protein